jgi:hypothetical protein
VKRWGRDLERDVYEEKVREMLNCGGKLKKQEENCVENANRPISTYLVL